MRRTKRVALDTNYTRYAPIEALAELKARGFLLSMPVTVLGEWWAGTVQRDRDGQELARFSGRLRRLVTVLDEREPLLPDGAVLKRYLEATPAQGAELRRQSCEDARQRLLRLLDEGVTHETWTQVGHIAKDQIDAIGALFMRGIELARARPRLERPASEREAVVAMKRAVAIDAGLLTLLERNDAFFSVFALRGARALYETPGTDTRIEANDAEDHQLLTHLAWPAIIATQDGRLIRAVDESGSHQRPWVRTIFEILNEPIPDGPTWGRSAKRAARRFERTCPHDALIARDKELLDRFRAAKPTVATS